MSEYTPITETVRAGYIVSATLNHTRQIGQVIGEFDRWLAEVEHAAAEKALRDVAGELAELGDGGRRGVKCHSKSHASSAAHQFAIDVVFGRAEAYRRNEGENA